MLERDAVVGGLAQTVEHNGYLFDIGGHRFYTSVPLVQQLWEETLGDDLLTRPRLSRIYYHGRFFHYPMEVWNVFRNLGPWEVARCTASYVKSHLSPVHPEDDFETWVSNRFGKRLFDLFFRTYTEKVWGIPCKEIRAEWAAQRIRGLSFVSVARNAMRGSGAVRSLIKSFRYPRKGPGMMWERMAERLQADGCPILLEHPVERIELGPGGVTRVWAGGREFKADHVVNTLALRDWIGMLEPAAPKELAQAANGLRYRDFLTVALMVRGRDLFPDNWIYVHEPGVAVGRVQNYTNWSPEMSPDPEISCLGLEYFCNDGDSLWNSTDAALVSRATSELDKLGLTRGHEIVDAAVVRAAKAYPVYDGNYKSSLELIRDWLNCVPNMHVAGRNGMHRYNNQDHAMLSGILAARNAAGADHDLWALAHGEQYLEETSDALVEDWKRLEESQPRVPERMVKGAGT